MSGEWRKGGVVLKGERGGARIFVVVDRTTKKLVTYRDFFGVTQFTVYVIPIVVKSNQNLLIPAVDNDLLSIHNYSP